MKHFSVLVLSVGAVIASGLFMFPRWYVTYDPWMAERERAFARDARRMEAWHEYSRMPWLKLAAVEGQFRPAAQNILRTVTTHGLRPDEYRVRIFQWPESSVYEVALKHVDHFALDRDGKTKDSLGDMCGKCRSLIYDPKTEAISPLYR